MAKRHLALYGNVAIPRRYCGRCECWTFVVDGMRNCCGYSNKADLQSTKVRRMCASNPIRKRPTLRERQIILNRQENCCLYCQQRFGSYFRRGEKLVRVDLAFDHLEPHCYGYNNDVRNFVAACRSCNGWKSSKMFESIEAIRRFVLTRWRPIWEKYGCDPELPARIAAIRLKESESTKSTVALDADGNSGKLKIPEVN